MKPFFPVIYGKFLPPAKQWPWEDSFSTSPSWVTPSLLNALWDQFTIYITVSLCTQLCTITLYLVYISSVNNAVLRKFKPFWCSCAQQLLASARVISEVKCVQFSLTKGSMIFLMLCRYDLNMHFKKWLFAWLCIKSVQICCSINNFSTIKNAWSCFFVVYSQEKKSLAFNSNY